MQQSPSPASSEPPSPGAARAALPCPSTARGKASSARGRQVAVVGTGPAGLMAAHTLALAGVQVRLHERRSSPGRKLLVAGASGLNVGAAYEGDDLLAYYSIAGLSAEQQAARLRPVLGAFGTRAWLDFLHELGVRTFEGTSRRYFVEGMKAPPLLAAWLARLAALGVELVTDSECVGWGVVEGRLRLRFASGKCDEVDAAVLCLGGGSWEPRPVTWPGVMAEHGIACRPLAPANVGYRVAWPAALLAEAEGQPIKNARLTSSRGSRRGDLVITGYGVEGTPVYFVGEPAVVQLDLKPDQSLEQLVARLAAVRERLSPQRRIKRTLGLCPAALALLFHMPSPLQVGAFQEGASRHDELEAIARQVKAFPLPLLGPQPLREAISSTGGVCWSEVDEKLMLLRAPGVFVAGEMLDWDAPTGGFLIQGCVATGRVAAQGVLRLLQNQRA